MKKINDFTIIFVIVAIFTIFYRIFGVLLLVLLPINAITDAKRTLRLIARNTCLRTTITASNLLVLLVVFADLTLARSVRIECLVAVNTEQLATITTADKPIILLAVLTALIALLRLCLGVVASALTLDCVLIALIRHLPLVCLCE